MADQVFIGSVVLPDRVIGLATAGWRFLTFYFQLGLASVLFFLLNLRRGGSLLKPVEEKHAPR